jgi:hypothetical protein
LSLSLSRAGGSPFSGTYRGVVRFTTDRLFVINLRQQCSSSDRTLQDAAGPRPRRPKQLGPRGASPAAKLPPRLVLACSHLTHRQTQGQSSSGPGTRVAEGRRRTRGLRTGGPCARGQHPLCRVAAGKQAVRLRGSASRPSSPFALFDAAPQTGRSFVPPQQRAHHPRRRASAPLTDDVELRLRLRGRCPPTSARIAAGPHGGRGDRRAWRSHRRRTSRPGLVLWGNRPSTRI